jgi:hypothetical protein
MVVSQRTILIFKPKKMENLVTLKLEDKIENLSFDIYEPATD